MLNKEQRKSYLNITCKRLKEFVHQIVADLILYKNKH